MPDTDDIAIFVRIIELGSLSAAGRDMRLSPAVVSNRVARLEGSLGVRLLNRTTRRVSPTEEGATFYEHCLSILNELEQAESVISERAHRAARSHQGDLPSAFGRLHVAPHVPAFLARHPHLQVRLHLPTAWVDLVQERIDLAIRIAELADFQAIARKLAPNRRVIVAAPAYLARHRRPPRARRPPEA